MLELEIKWTNFFKILWSRKLKYWVHKWIVKVLQFLEWKAIPETPIMTWTLRKWYKTKAIWIWGKLYNGTEYAGFVHDWTKYITANPFLRRVEKENSSGANRIMNREIWKVLASL